MADWDQNKPADNDLISQFPSNERDARDAVRTNFGVDHRETDDADVGKHELVELLAQTTPTAVSGQGHFYTKDVGSGQIELFYQDAAGNEIQLTVSGAPGGFESGTKCVFYQASAPTGWTQDTSIHDRVLRVVDNTGTGGATGGSWTISGLTNGSLSVDGHPLTISEMPSHNHGGGNHGHNFDLSDDGGSSAFNSTRDWLSQSGSDYSLQSTLTNPVNTARVRDSVRNSGTIISSQGGGSSHSHGLSGSPGSNGSWRPSHADVIVATKD